MTSLDPTGTVGGYELLDSCPDIVAFVTSRHGGCSTGAYASMNCTPYTGDDPECVERNQKILCSSLPHRPKELIIPYQTHGSRSLVIDDCFVQATAETRHEMLQGIDALITKEAGYCLCISTADCIPILLYDRTHRVVAAVHAGWRGTADRILAQTLKRLQALYGSEGGDMLACMGPGISLPAFEVGDEVYEAFRERSFPMSYIAEWRPDTHKYHIDLWAANLLQLKDFGVPDNQVQNSGICTYTRHQDFFSARRLGVKSGRILSGIFIR